MESCPTWHNLHLRQQYHATSQSLQTANTLPLYQEPSHFRVLSYAISPVIYIKRFTPFTGSDLIWLNIFPGSDSVFPDLIWLKVFDWIQIFFPDSIWPKVLTGFNWIRLSFPKFIWLTVFDGIWIRFFLIQFDSHLTQLFSIRVKSFKFHSSQTSGNTILDRLSLK